MSALDHKREHDCICLILLFREEPGYCGLMSSYLAWLRAYTGTCVYPALERAKLHFDHSKFSANLTCLLPPPGQLVQLNEVSFSGESDFSLRPVKEPLASASPLTWLIGWPSRRRLRFPRKGGCIDCSWRLLASLVVWWMVCAAAKAAYRETLPYAGGRKEVREYHKVVPV